ncbi:MAG: ribonuclease III [Anaerolineae bacterium]
MPELGDLEKRIGHRFSSSGLLVEALVHPSFLNENPEFGQSDNQRLEFLGDSVLNYIAAEYLFQRFPDLPEGELTSLRAALVRSKTLAGFARAFNLGRFLYLGRGEAESGGRERTTTLADGFEALLGAISLDGGLEAGRRWLVPLLDAATAEVIANAGSRDYKSLLQERIQAELREPPRYRTVEMSGPDHDRRFTVEVLVGQRVTGRGTGSSKQEAEQAAAQVAWESLPPASGNAG